MSEAVVGSVAIEIVPAANDFGRKLRDALLPDANRVGDEVGRQLSNRIQAAMGGARVRVDTTQARTDVDRLQARISDLGRGAATRIQVDTAEFDARIAGIKAQLAEIQRTRLQVTVDTAAADARLQALVVESRQLKEALKTNADINVDEAQARLAEIATEIQSIRDNKAQVRVDTAEAAVRVQALKDELDRVTGERKIKIDVDTAAARAEIAAARAAAADNNSSANVGDGGAGLSLSGGFSAMTAGLSLLPALIPVAASLIPILEGIGMAAVGAGAGVGVLALAFHGIGSAVSALGKQSSQTGQQLAAQASQQLSAANSILNAQDAVKAAVQGVADAERSAAASVRNAQQGVVQAEQSYTSAVYNERQAQLDVIAARKAAAQQLEDLNNQVKDGALSQRQATADLQAAQQNLTVVDFNPHSTQAQRDAAQLAVDQAKQHLSELELANSRLAASKAQADKQGVANAPTVLAAEHSLKDATQSRADAQRALVKAQADVVEARRAGAEQVAKADQAVIQSQRALAQAYAASAAAGSTSANAVNAAMANLTPAGQAFAHFVNDQLRPAFKTLTDAAQTGFLPGLQAAIQNLLPYMPGFAKFVGDIAREMGNMAVQASKALTGPFWSQFFTFLGDLAKSSLPVLGAVLGNLATGFAGLFQALAPSAGGVGGGLEKITKAFADWATHLGTNQGFQKFLQFIKDNAPGVGKFFADLFVVVGKLIIAFAPLGAALAVGLEKLFGWLSSLSPGQLIGIAAGLGAIGLAIIALTGGPVTIVVLALTAIVGGLVYAYTHFKTFRDIVNTVWHDIAVSAQWLWVNVLKPTFNFIVDHWHYVATAFKLYWDYYLHPVLTAWWTAVQFLWNDILKPTFAIIVATFHDTAVAFSAVYNSVLKPVWSAFSTAFSGVSKAFSSFRDGLSTVWGDIKRIFTDGYNFVTQNVLNKFIDAVNKVTSVLGVPNIPNIPALKAPASGGGVNLGTGPGGRAPTFAHGGIVPGFAPGMDVVHAMLSPGEGVLVPEAVQALGPGFIHSVNKQFSNRTSGAGHFAGGGVVGGVLSAGAEQALSGAEAPIKALIGRLTPEIVKKLAQGGFGRIDGGIRSWIKDHVGGIGAGINIPSLAHSTLIKAALKLAGVADTAGNESDVDMIVKFESGWNPNAINLTDSNAVAGHPSQGLMQTIPSTFEGNRLASLPDNINDPLANLVAGIRYAIGRYGSLDGVPGVASVHRGGPYVGYDSGGVLPPGVTQVYNGTGKPERVFTDAQWQKLTAAGQNRSAVKSSGKIADTLHLHGENPEAVITEITRRQAMQASI